MQHFRRHDPVSSSLGIEVLDVGREYSLVEMPPHGCQLNGMGAVHDGAVFVLADVAFAALSNANGLYCTNAQTSISFVRSGRVGPCVGKRACSVRGAAFHIRGPGNRCRRGPCGRGDHNRLWRRRAASSGGCIAFAGSASGVPLRGVLKEGGGCRVCRRHVVYSGHNLAGRGAGVSCVRAVFFGLGAWAAGVTALFVDDLAIEVVVFGASSVVFLLSLRRLFVRSFRGKTQISSDAASVGLPNLHAGKMGTVTRPIPVNGVGEISVGGSFWRAVSPEAQPEGAQVRVLGHIPDDELTLEVVSGGENSRNPA